MPKKYVPSNLKKTFSGMKFAFGLKGPSRGMQDFKEGTLRYGPTGYPTPEDV